MCKVCGCGSGEVRLDGVSAAVEHEHRHRHPEAQAGEGADACCGHRHAHVHGHADHDHSHDHDHHSNHYHDHDHQHDCDHTHNHDHHHAHAALDFGRGPAGASVPGQSQSRLLRIEQDILARNDAIAAGNRRRLAAARVLALNLVSSPGAGKTSLLVATLQRLAGVPAAVIEGDQETSADAERIRATGVPAIQINTGKGCHLDARMVEQALDRLAPPAGGVLFIENVGNLVCPAGFDLGEAHKVVICSVTEGEDKPLKYPGMFAASDLLLVSKIDLLPYLDFDLERLVDNARRVNPGIAVLQVSARSGDGIDRWLAWLTAARALRQAGD
jgi:hydrogenase nickel incorporation protein HypB